MLRPQPDRDVRRDFFHYLDTAVHWGILHRLPEDIGTHAAILITAIALDATVLVALLIIKTRPEIMVIYGATVGMLIIFAGEHLPLRTNHQSGS